MTEQGSYNLPIIFLLKDNAVLAQDMLDQPQEESADDCFNTTVNSYRRALVGELLRVGSVNRELFMSTLGRALGTEVDSVAFSQAIEQVGEEFCKGGEKQIFGGKG